MDGTFPGILYRPPPITESNITEAETDLDINVDPPSLGEIVNAPGVDDLDAELFKADPMSAAKILL